MSLLPFRATLTVALLGLATGCDRPASAEVAANTAEPARTPALRGPMPNGGLKKFQKTVADQVARFPEAVIVERITDDKIIALTFDDGPDPVGTPRLLTILARHDVKATFFLVGERMESYPKLVKRIRDAGHAVAGHGYQHIDHRKLTAETGYREQTEKTEAILERILGSRAGYFRPPYGAVTNEQIELFWKNGVKTALWSVDSLDWAKSHRTAVRVKKRVLDGAHPGAVVLMHDGKRRKHTADALPGIITELKRRGYAFQTMDEMF